MAGGLVQVLGKTWQELVHDAIFSSFGAETAHLSNPMSCHNTLYNTYAMSNEYPFYRLDCSLRYVLCSRPSQVALVLEDKIENIGELCSLGPICHR